MTVSTDSGLLISVVICTLDRYADVEVCLEALTLASRATATLHEIILIDQTDPPERRSDLVERFPSIRHIHQDDKGLSSARNLGFRESVGDIIAYLDDDAVPGIDWITEIAKPFLDDTDGKIMACGGKVVADYRKAARPEWMTPSLEAYLSCVDWGEMGRPLRPGEWIVGANMAFRRDASAADDPFDIALGRKGGKTLLSNEEVSFLEKIGIGKIWYEPNAKIGHVIALDRLEPKWFRKRVYWQAVSDLIADMVRITPAQAWADLVAFIASSPAEKRSLKALFQDCEGSEMFERQLKAIYGLTILGAGGFEIPS